MTYDEYDSLDGVRASDLKRMRESPRHYLMPRADTNTPSRGMLRAIHCAVLEPLCFSRDFVEYDGLRRGQKFDAFALRHRGKTILNMREWQVVVSVARYIRTDPVAGPFFSAGEGESEMTIQWAHPSTGIACKARIDRLARDEAGNQCLIDLKSYGTTDGRIVGRRADQLGAYIQLAHYDEGIRLALGIENARVLIVSAEMGRPYDVAVFELDRDGALAEGAIDRERLMARLAECVRTGHWPGRYECVQPLPHYIWSDPDDGIEDSIHE